MFPTLRKNNGIYHSANYTVAAPQDLNTHVLYDIRRRHRGAGLFSFGLLITPGFTGNIWNSNTLLVFNVCFQRRTLAAGGKITALMSLQQLMFSLCWMAEGRKVIHTRRKPTEREDIIGLFCSVIVRST